MSWSTSSKRFENKSSSYRKTDGAKSIMEAFTSDENPVEFGWSTVLAAYFHDPQGLRGYSARKRLIMFCVCTQTKSKERLQAKNVTTMRIYKCVYRLQVHYIHMRAWEFIYSHTAEKEREIERWEWERRKRALAVRDNCARWDSVRNAHTIIPKRVSRRICTSHAEAACIYIYKSHTGSEKFLMERCDAAASAKWDLISFISACFLLLRFRRMFALLDEFTQRKLISLSLSLFFAVAVIYLFIKILDHDSNSYCWSSKFA